MTKNNKILLTVIIVIVSLCLLTVSVPMALWLIRKDKYKTMKDQAVTVRDSGSENVSGAVTEEKSYSAWVTDAAGAVTYVKNFETFYESRTGNFIVYLNDAQSTLTTWNALHLLTDRYSAEIPFEIIDSVVTRPVPNGYYINNDYHVAEASVHLGDGTILKGAPQRSFSGKSELGDFKIEAERARRILFDHKALAVFTAKTNGNHSLDVVFLKKETLHLDSASFLKERVNTNGCYTGNDYTDQIDFSSEGGTNLTVGWDKIAAIVLVSEKSPYDKQITLKKYKLVTRSGVEYTGNSKYGNYGAVHKIQELAKIGGYKLRVIVDFYGCYERMNFH